MMFLTLIAELYSGDCEREATERPELNFHKHIF